MHNGAGSPVPAMPGWQIAPVSQSVSCSHMMNDTWRTSYTRVVKIIRLPPHRTMKLQVRNPRRLVNFGWGCLQSPRSTSKAHLQTSSVYVHIKGKHFPIIYAVVGEWGIRNLSFSRGQHIEGDAHLLSLAALPSLTLKRAGTHLQLGDLRDCSEANARKWLLIYLVPTLGAA